MKKIIVDKAQDIAEVIDRILGEPDGDIALVVPKNSVLGKSVRNFTLLKRETDAGGKSVVIESVDDNILAFAKQAGIDASHPLWRSVRGAGGFSDIIVKDENSEEASSPKKSRTKKKAVEPVTLKVPTDEADETDEEATVQSPDAPETEEEAEAEESIQRNRFFTSISAEDRKRRETSRKREGGDVRKVSAKVWWTLVAVVIAIGIVAYALTVFFNRADISINFKQTPWSYQGNFVADKAASAIGNNTVPAQIFTSAKNVTQLFPASSHQNVSIKAQGTITIYNAYNSSPQQLVATTRFLTPDGKIFRLASNVIIPGAQVANGQITPSSVSAIVVADQPGPNYNVGPVAKLTIPGFQKDPGRYQGFYGTIASGTTGGYVGQKAVPTAADVKAAQASTTAILQASLSNGFTTNYPNNFKILDGATTYQIGKLIVNTSTDANGNFTVLGQATMEAIGFDEGALKNYLLSLAQTTENNSAFASLNMDYSAVQANFTTGKVNFTAIAHSELEPAFDPADFTNSILGKSIAEARGSILALPNLSDGTISVWPLWLMHIPSDANKVHLTVR
jgi:hypothetical protein